MIEFNTKMDLMNTLKDSNQRAESWCREISAIDFFHPAGRSLVTV
jgi:hypothetical protein